MGIRILFGLLVGLSFVLILTGHKYARNYVLFGMGFRGQAAVLREMFGRWKGFIVLLYGGITALLGLLMGGIAAKTSDFIDGESLYLVEALSGFVGVVLTMIAYSSCIKYMVLKTNSSTHPSSIHNLIYIWALILFSVSAFLLLISSQKVLIFSLIIISLTLLQVLKILTLSEIVSLSTSMLTI